MSSSLITVAIPTRNRPEYLKQALISVIEQTYKEMRIVVIDNDSDSEYDSKAVVEELADPRVEYIRNKKNLGIIGNWNKAIEICDTKYLSIFHDDDIMLPEFIARSIANLEENPSAGMSYSHANKVDTNLQFVSIWSDLIPGVGLVSGDDYLKFTVEHGCCLTIAPTTVVRKDVYKNVGIYSEELCFNSFDFNMWVKIAAQYDVFFIDEVLVNYRLHEKQMSQTYWWSDDKNKGRLATMLEVIKAITILMEKGLIAYELAAKKIAEYNVLTAQYAKALVDGL